MSMKICIQYMTTFLLSITLPILSEIEKLEQYLDYDLLLLSLFTNTYSNFGLYMSS